LFASLLFLLCLSFYFFLKTTKKMSHLPPVLNAREEDVQKMLACQVHIGARNLDPAMGRYIWKRRNDGVFLIDLQKNLGEISFSSKNYCYH